MLNYFLIGLGLGLVSLTNVSCKCLRPSVLIVSFDGFRHDYISKEDTPNMLKLRSKGTYVDHMRNVFPTKTFPNHHSIATGVYPEVHGVLGNLMYDPIKNVTLKYDEIWNFNKDVVPIWTLNEGSEGCHSGTMMWPGSDQTYQKKKPKFTTTWDSSVAWRDRVDGVVKWFADPTADVNLVMAYFEEPDYKSHKYGPNSEQALEQIKNVDNIIQYIYDQLVHHNLTHVNVFLLSDHGMDSIKKSKIIKVGEKIEDKYTAVKTSPLFFIWPKNKDKTEEDFIYDTLTKESKESGHFSVYRKSEIPDDWHFKKNDRVPPVLVVAKEGFAFQDLLTWRVPNFTVDNMTWGVHGYDNKQSNMWPFFMSWGPLIKVNHMGEPFKTLDLYSLWSEMLNIVPPPTNGSLADVKFILVRTVEDPMSAMGAVGISILVTAIIAIGLLIAFFVRRAEKSKYRRHDGNDLDPKRVKREGNPLLDKTVPEPNSHVV